MTGMRFADCRETSLATIPVGTVGTFGSNTRDSLVAQITGGGMSIGWNLSSSGLIVEETRKVSVDDGVESMVPGVDLAALVLQ
jgi:hypothetical protein